jgi:hypothetical protein
MRAHSSHLSFYHTGSVTPQTQFESRDLAAARRSQLSITYMIGFVLGMLARYFPTHWVSLAQGNKGDSLWPALNRAHGVENMHDPADDPPIVNPFHAANIRRQMRPNSNPLLDAQPKQIPAHDPDPLPNESGSYCPADMLMSFDPNYAPRPVGRHRGSDRTIQNSTASSEKSPLYVRFFSRRV